MTFGMRDDSITPKEEVQRAVGEAGVLRQTGTVKNPLRDSSRHALPPGKRISRTGKTYWELRKNRSDIPGEDI